MSDAMWAAAYSAQGNLEALSVPRPVPATGEVLIRVLAAAVPPGMGTTRECASTGIVGIVEQTDTGSAHLHGATIVLASCGDNDAIQGAAPGERPYLLAEYLTAAASHAIALPPHRLPQEGVLLDAAVQTLRGVRGAQVQIGDSVAVLGTQLSSVLAAQWVRIAGAYDVYVYEHDARGLAVARALWLGEVSDAASRDSAAHVLERTDGEGVAVAIVDAASDHGLERAVEMLRKGGTLLVSHRGCEPPGLPAAAAALAEQRGIRVMAYPARGACLAPRTDWEIAISTWAGGRLAMRGLITRTIPRMDVVAAVGAGSLSEGPHDWPAVVLSPELAPH